MITECEAQVRIKLDHNAVREIFDTATSQGQYLIGLYKLVFPEWDRIEKVDGWPVCNKATWTAICKACQDFDAKLNKERDWNKQMMVGGAWLNNGFSVLGAPADLMDWEVIPCHVIVKAECT